MAYQNVGKPRIFVDYYQYAHAIGIIDFSYVQGSGDPLYQTYPNRFGTNKSEMFMNPLRPATCTDFTGATTMWYYFDVTQPMWGMNFYAMLGHNMGSVTVLPTVNNYPDGEWTLDGYTSDSTTTYNKQGQGVEEIVNIQANTYSTSYVAPVYNGFSIWKHNEFLREDFGTGHSLHFTKWGGTGGFGSLNESDYSHLGTNGTYTGAFTPVCGRIFEFEHAPDLKLTMERQFDGVKSQKTIGGADISNTTYLGPPDQPYAGNPWTLNLPGTGDDILEISKSHAAKRMGRRIWKLKFSMLSDRVDGSGLMALNELSTPYGVDTSAAAGYSADEWENDGVQDVFKSDFWADDSFMGLVFAKTMGFTLPFIFQPDSNDNSPQNFAICKIDNKSLKITQSNFKKYDIQLTIREVW